MEENPFAELEVTQPKTKLWYIVAEKIVGVIVFLFGVGIIFGIYYDSTDTLFNYREDFGVFYAIKLFLYKNGYLSLLLVGCLYSGFFLILKRKYGWIGCLAIIAHLAFFLGITLFDFDVSRLDQSTFDTFFTLGFLALLVGFLAVLVSKQARNRYQLSRKDYLIPAGLFVVLNILRYLTIGHL